MFTKSTLALLSFVTVALSCPDHGSLEAKNTLGRRATGVNDWQYDAVCDWGSIKEEYHACRDGSFQSPIPLQTTQGLALSHHPTFDFPELSNGTFLNWGYGPSFNLPTTTDYSHYPSATFNEGEKDETVFLKGWHIHTPGEHSIDGRLTKAEMHYVFANAEGKERAVFGMRINPGNYVSEFFSRLPSLISHHEPEKQEIVELDLGLALKEVESFSEFWTYKGSLTSPPCTEGLRWFVAKDILYVSNEQMQNILGVSKYSSRTEQEVWLHEINA